MSKELTVFEYEKFQVRTVVKDGEPWFVAKDVCDVLEIKNGRDAVSRLDADEKGTVVLTDGTSPKGGNPNSSIVNEFGLYNLVLTSRKPEAKEFKRWVTHHVLPTIRKTGGYVMGEENALSEAELTLRVVTMLKNKVDLLTRGLEFASIQLEEQAPKVEFHDAVMEREKLVNLTSVMKLRDWEAIVDTFAELKKVSHNPFCNEPFGMLRA